MTTVNTSALRDALGIVEDAFTGASGVLSTLGTAAPGGVHWRATPLDSPRKLPVVIVQPQENGRRTPYVGHVGWEGLVVIRALAATTAQARTCLAAVAQAIPAAFDLGDYRLTAVLDKPILLPIPVGASTQQAAIQYLITINRR